MKKNARLVFGFSLLPSRTAACRGSGACARSFSSISGVVNDHPMNNVPANVADKVGKRLLHVENHPLQIIKSAIFNHFPSNWKLFDDFDPIVTTEQCFDQLLTPKDHVSRLPSETFYVDDARVLRTHTSAHQNELISGGNTAFLCAGDVYRRDTVDVSHYPIFHQMEGVKIFDPSAGVKDVEAALCEDLEGMVKTLFGDVEMRWVEAYFPFTRPSLELEIYFRDEWLEVLGCGVIHEDIMRNCGVGDRQGYAFGLGLERLAMVLFSIPDIRLFWTDDERFMKQFSSGSIGTTFEPYSKYPPCIKDISFWLPNNGEEFHENDIHTIARLEGGDLIESVSLVDDFTNAKTGRTSHCYRIMYRSMDRSLSNEEINAIQENVRMSLKSKLGVELR